MPGFPHDSADVIVVQKQTALERYTRRALNVDFLEYVEQGGGSLEDLKVAHDEHTETREVVLQALAARGLSTVVWNLDELSASGTPFFLPASGGFGRSTATEGLVPRKRLVVSLGGDGTLLHASHHVGGDVRVLGVNSCPAHSVGALCAAKRESFARMLDDVLSGATKALSTRRLLVETSENHRLPLALNDVLLCNQHPAATSRYQISVVPEADENGCVPLRTEAQLSSGLWIAAPAGGSAVIRGYGMPVHPLGSRTFQIAVREPYFASGVSPSQPPPQYTIDRLELDGDRESLALFCRMRAGLVCVDGPDNGVRLGFGARVRLSLGESTALLLVPPAAK